MFTKKCIDNRTKNTKREITNETKQIVYSRDEWKCVICKCWTQDEFHHINYGWSAIYTDNRNDPDQLVLLCHNCHNKLHFEWYTEYRDKTIEYITNYYENNSQR